MRSQQIRVIQVLFAGAATVAALLLFSTVRPGATDTVVASGSAIAGAGGFATDDGFVNDNGQTSGDIFQQNAQDQSSP